MVIPRNEGEFCKVQIRLKVVVEGACAQRHAEELVQKRN
jgi:hypothetical protein